MDAQTEKYRLKLEQATDLPTLSKVLVRLQQMIRDPKADAGEIGRLVNQDIALASKTLRFVNSSFYGFSQRIDNITHAVVILGLNKVKNLVFTASVLDAFSGRATQDFDYAGFWEHAIGTAIAAEALAMKLKSPYAIDAFVAGLLHDQGKLILDEYFPEDYASVRARIQSRELTFFEAENEVLGFNHGLTGMWVAQQWQFPEQLVAAIRNHHEPAVARQHRELVWLVHVADVLARALGLGNGGDPFIPELDPGVWAQLHLSFDLADSVLEDTLVGMKNAEDFLRLIRNPGVGL